MPKRGPKALAWDGVTPMRTGVSRGRYEGTYRVSLRRSKPKSVNYLDEANALRAECDAAHALFMATDTDEARRARNLAKNGSNSELERAFAQRLLHAFESLGWECHILNDFTLADILVRPRGDGKNTWYWVQLKTCTECNSRGQWHFNNVSHYGRMLVVCHALKGPTRIPGTHDEFKPCTWVYDGETLARHIPCGQLDVTPGKTYVWDDVSMRRLLAKCDADDLEACAVETAVLIKTLLLATPTYYPRTPKHVAKWTFESPNHFAEFVSLNFLMRSADASVCTVALPEAQQPTYDLEETCKATQEMLRLQAKMAHLHCRKIDGSASYAPSRSGLEVITMKNIGDRKHGPYGPNDFDHLVAVWRDVTCGLWHVWRIPIGKIPTDEKTKQLVTNITVHVPRDLELPPGVDREAAHGPAPRLKGSKGRGRICETYDWSTPYHECHEMCNEWEPPVPWPDELRHMWRKLRFKCVPAESSSEESESEEEDASPPPKYRKTVQ